MNAVDHEKQVTQAVDLVPVFLDISQELYIHALRCRCVDFIFTDGQDLARTGLKWTNLHRSPELIR